MERLLAGLRAAAEPTRIRILALCAHGELSVTELTQILGQSQPRVSRHLKLLCEADLLDRIREGTNAFFRIAEEGPGALLARTLVDLLPADGRELALDLERLQAMRRERAERAAAYFRDNAARWDEIRALHIADSEVERALAGLLPAEGVDALVDLGTGTGQMLRVLAGRTRRLVGIDLSREMLAVARANLERAGLKGWQVRHGDLYQLPLPSAAFDAAVMHQVLHYLEEPQAALAETARILKPGALLLLADFARHGEERLREEHAHRWLGFADEEVALWLRQAGFDCAEAVHLPGDPLTVTIWPARRRAESNVRPLPARAAAKG
jgi:ArsR family transcriptional regulator